MPAFIEFLTMTTKAERTISNDRRLPALFLLSLMFTAGGTISPARSDGCISPDQLKANTIDRTFTQDRFMSGMEQPLRSKGRLQVQNDRISWHMMSPFDVETIITPKAITQSIAGGPATPVAPAASAIGAPIAKSLVSLLQGQWSELGALFDVSRAPATSGADWVVSLHPHDPNLQAALGSIEVKGCTDISTVEITRPDGDREVIRFDASGTVPAP